MVTNKYTMKHIITSLLRVIIIAYTSAYIDGYQEPLFGVMRSSLMRLRSVSNTDFTLFLQREVDIFIY